jgi:hypothetical protein
MLNADRHERITIKHARKHPWFNGTGWRGMRTHSLKAPFADLCQKKMRSAKTSGTSLDEKLAAVVDPNNCSSHLTPDEQKSFDKFDFRTKIVSATRRKSIQQFVHEQAVAPAKRELTRRRSSNAVLSPNSERKGLGFEFDSHNNHACPKAQRIASMPDHPVRQPVPVARSPHQYGTTLPGPPLPKQSPVIVNTSTDSDEETLTDALQHSVISGPIPSLTRTISAPSAIAPTPPNVETSSMMVNGPPTTTFETQHDSEDESDTSELSALTLDD